MIAAIIGVILFAGAVLAAVVWLAQYALNQADQRRKAEVQQADTAADLRVQTANVTQLQLVIERQKRAASARKEVADALRHHPVTGPSARGIDVLSSALDFAADLGAVQSDRAAPSRRDGAGGGLPGGPAVSADPSGAAAAPGGEHAGKVHER